MAQCMLHANTIGSDGSATHIRITDNCIRKELKSRTDELELQSTDPLDSFPREPNIRLKRPRNPNT